MSVCINIAICEDDEKQLQINKNYIEEWAKLREKKINVFSYSSAENFLFHWNYEVSIDIAFLDIQMDKVSGIELAQNIRKQDENISIVFITGESRYVFEGYKVQALDYLMKPVKKEEIFQCLDLFNKRIEKKRDAHFILKKGKEIQKINYDDIHYFISFDHYLDIHTRDEVITFKEKIGKIEEELSKEQFCRCHRSYVVNLKYIDSIYKNEIIMDDGTKIPVSKSRLNTTYEAFMNYFKQNN